MRIEPRPGVAFNNRGTAPRKAPPPPAGDGKPPGPQRVFRQENPKD